MKKGANGTREPPTGVEIGKWNRVLERIGDLNQDSAMKIRKI